MSTSDRVFETHPAADEPAGVPSAHGETQTVTIADPATIEALLAENAELNH